jgi:sulfatase modifying factor 1
VKRAVAVAMAALGGVVLMGACAFDDAKDRPGGPDGGGSDGSSAAAVTDRDSATHGATDSGKGGDVGDAGTSDGGKVDSAADSGPVDAPSSCEGLPATCGPGGNRNCCASSVVPGGSYKRSYDTVTFTDPSFAATVSDFRLDIYEATVGRFRAFVAGYPANLPAAGAGKNANSVPDHGWDTSWNASMPATSAALVVAIKCYASAQTWTDAVGANENKAMNCVSWYEAAAFCIWDGGRLPSEAEWNYAAAAGNEQRLYAWSTPASSTLIDSTYAVYNGTGAVASVGTKSPKGDGKWGHADLTGNVWEWTADSYESPYAINPCNNCVDLIPASRQALRGGAFNDPASASVVSLRGNPLPTDRGYPWGIRCARNL